MNYEELVKALRCCAENFGCPIECPRYSPADEGVRACVSRLEKDAAAAIEELQAELEKKRTADCCGCKCEKLGPKCGKWEQVEVIGYDGNSMNDDAARCSVCGYVEQSVYWARTYYHYCPNCGADMRKMEVQDV